MNYKNIITICLILNTLSLFSQTEIKSEIKSVTVYRKGARVQSEVKTVLKPGLNKVSFVGNPDKIVAKSVQLSGAGDFSIISVKLGTSYTAFDDAIKNKKEKALEKIDILTAQLNIANVNVEAIRLEETLLLSNSQIGGKNTGVSILELKQIAIYYSQTLAQIKQRQKQMKAKIDRINEEIRILKLDLNQKDNPNKWFSKIDVVLKSQMQTNATLSLDYFTAGAGWNPIYDARVNDLNGKINVVYKAQIFQNTGLDWNNVNLKISTAEPLVNNEKPIVRKRYVTAYVAYDDNLRTLNGRSAPGRVSNMVSVEQLEVTIDSKADSYVNGVKVVETVKVQNPTNIDFTIEKPYTITSNNKPYLVEIKKHVFDAFYEVYAAPEWDKSAYLTAKSMGWDGNGFEPGNMNIFLGGTFIGTTVFDPSSISDTLMLSLGKDKSTTVDRVITSNFSKSKALSSKEEETYVYTIKVKNNRNYPIKLRLEEQIPISKSDVIKVTFVSTGGASQNLETGILTWTPTLKPMETITISYSYSVKKPKDKQIDIVY